MKNENNIYSKEKFHDGKIWTNPKPRNGFRQQKTSKHWRQKRK